MGDEVLFDDQVLAGKSRAEQQQGSANNNNSCYHLPPAQHDIMALRQDSRLGTGGEADGRTGRDTGAER